MRNKITPLSPYVFKTNNDQRIRGFFYKWYALYKSTFTYLLTYLTGAVVSTEHYYIVRCFILAVLSTVLSSRWNLAETNTSRNTRLMKNKNSVKLQPCSKDSQQAWIHSCGQHRTSVVCLFYLPRSSHKKVKVDHTRLPSVGFWRWSRF